MKRYLFNEEKEIIAEYDDKYKNIYKSKDANDEEIEAFKIELNDDGYSVVSII